MRPGGVLSNTAMARKNERYAEGNTRDSTTRSSMDAFNSGAQTHTIEGADEADRIASVMGQAATAYGQPHNAHHAGGQFKTFARGSGGTGGGHGFGNYMTDRSPRPGPNYICHRCMKPGHWIDQCPTNGDPAYDRIKVRAPTGIPRSMLRTVDAPETGTGLKDSSGQFVALQPNEAEFARQTVGLRMSQAAARMLEQSPRDAPNSSISHPNLTATEPPDSTASHALNPNASELSTPADSSNGLEPQLTSRVSSVAPVSSNGASDSALAQSSHQALEYAQANDSSALQQNQNELQQIVQGESGAHEHTQTASSASLREGDVPRSSASQLGPEMHDQASKYKENTAGGVPSRRNRFVSRASDSNAASSFEAQGGMHSSAALGGPFDPTSGPFQFPFGFPPGYFPPGVFPPGMIPPPGVLPPALIPGIPPGMAPSLPGAAPGLYPGIFPPGMLPPPVVFPQNAAASFSASQQTAPSTTDSNKTRHQNSVATTDFQNDQSNNLAGMDTETSFPRRQGVVDIQQKDLNTENVGRQSIVDANSTALQHRSTVALSEPQSLRGDLSSSIDGHAGNSDISQQLPNSGTKPVAGGESCPVPSTSNKLSKQPHDGSHVAEAHGSDLEDKGKIRRRRDGTRRKNRWRESEISSEINSAGGNTAVTGESKLNSEETAQEEQSQDKEIRSRSATHDHMSSAKSSSESSRREVSEVNDELSGDRRLREEVDGSAEQSKARHQEVKDGDDIRDVSRVKYPDGESEEVRMRESDSRTEPSLPRRNELDHARADAGSRRTYGNTVKSEEHDLGDRDTHVFREIVPREYGRSEECHGDVVRIDRHYKGPSQSDSSDRRQSSSPQKPRLDERRGMLQENSRYRDRSDTDTGRDRYGTDERRIPPRENTAKRHYSDRDQRKYARHRSPSPDKYADKRYEGESRRKASRSDYDARSRSLSSRDARYRYRDDDFDDRRARVYREPRDRDDADEDFTKRRNDGFEKRRPFVDRRDDERFADEVARAENRDRKRGRQDRRRLPSDDLDGEIPVKKARKMGSERTSDEPRTRIKQMDVPHRQKTHGTGSNGREERVSVLDRLGQRKSVHDRLG